MNTILEVFDAQSKAGHYINFEKDILTAIKHSLTGLSYHIITSRIKSADSLKSKITTKNKYSSLGEITDLVGIRIITYYQSDVNIIKNRLEHSFQKDEYNSIDKRGQIGNSFGYASLHLILSMAIKHQYNQYERIPYEELSIDVSKYQNTGFEVQLRTILEHAWAEIEHDLGYKSELKSGLPTPIKRGFARVAALLETADGEFVRLRRDLSSKIAEIAASEDKTDYSEWIIAGPSDNRDVNKFFINSRLVGRIENEILSLTNQSRTIAPGYVDFKHVTLMYENGLQTIEKIRDFIEVHENGIKEVAMRCSNTSFDYAHFKSHSGLYHNFLITYVCLYIVGISSRNDVEAERGMKKYVGGFNNVWLRAIQPLINPNK